MSWNRRDVLRIGALSLMGTQFEVGEAQAAPATLGNGNRCIYIFLQGGPSHIDLWDPKPKAAKEIRGPYQPIETAVPGIRFGQLLPRAAKIAKHLAVIRSMTHGFNNHIAGTYIMQTGSKLQANTDREAAPDDFPGPGAVLNYLQPVPPKIPVSVSLPNWLSIPGPSNRMPGQYAGVLGSAYDPFLIKGDPAKKDFKPLSLSLPDDVPRARFQSRTALLEQIDQATRDLESVATKTRDRLYRTAIDLLTDPRVRDALDLSKESPQRRDRYGRNKIGQSLLLSRRLVEAGVKFVSYNAFNQNWDTHGAIENTYRTKVPQMEQAYTALIEDLEERGLLETTLVVNTGEFGRTPVINGNAGRDHWPQVFTTVLAGGGVRGGQVVGSSDSKGEAPAQRPVSPADFLATLWTVLGVDPHTELRDRLDRPLALSSGQLIGEIL